MDSGGQGWAIRSKTALEVMARFSYHPFLLLTNYSPYNGAGLCNARRVGVTDDDGSTIEL